MRCSYKAQTSAAVYNLPWSDRSASEAWKVNGNAHACSPTVVTCAQSGPREEREKHKRGHFMASLKISSVHP